MLLGLNISGGVEVALERCAVAGVVVTSEVVEGVFEVIVEGVVVVGIVVVVVGVVVVVDIVDVGVLVVIDGDGAADVDVVVGEEWASRVICVDEEEEKASSTAAAG